MVKRLFPLLQQKSVELRQQGVNFSDQTLVFAGCSEKLYVDPWCHFNTEGNRILCESISATVLKNAGYRQSRHRRTNRGR